MKLSFVIPTLNFAKFLPETLNSIIDEGYPVEIVVFDGGSTDNTMAVLDRYRAEYPDLKVFVASERGSIDIDLNKAVAEAAGNYIWTISADDALLPGWSRQIPPLLDREAPDLVLVPAIHGDIHMRPRRNYPILRNGNRDLQRTIANEADLLEYLSKIRTSEGLFSFCSACIVRRDRLMATIDLEAANGTCWRYSARLINVLTTYPSKITVLHRPLLLKRGDNDSFALAGMIQRLKIATLNWDRAIGALPLPKSVSSAMRRLVKSDIRPSTLLYYSQFTRDRDEQRLFAACVRSRIEQAPWGERMIGRLIALTPRNRALKWGLINAKALFRRSQEGRWRRGIPSSHN